MASPNLTPTALSHQSNSPDQLSRLQGDYLYPGFAPLSAGISFQPFTFDFLFQTTFGTKQLKKPYEGFQDNFQPPNGEPSFSHRMDGFIDGHPALVAAPYIQKHRVRLSFPVQYHSEPFFKKTTWNAESIIYNWWDPLPTDREQYTYNLCFGTELGVWATDFIRPAVGVSLVPWERYNVRYAGEDHYGAPNTVNEIQRDLLDKGTGLLLEAGAYLGNGKRLMNSDRFGGSFVLGLGGRALIFRDDVAIGFGFTIGGSFDAYLMR